MTLRLSNDAREALDAARLEIVAAFAEFGTASDRANQIAAKLESLDADTRQARATVDALDETKVARLAMLERQQQLLESQLITARKHADSQRKSLLSVARANAALLVAQLSPCLPALVEEIAAALAPYYANAEAANHAARNTDLAVSFANALTSLSNGIETEGEAHALLGKIVIASNGLNPFWRDDA